MLDRPATHRAPRARALAELPVDALTARAADLARRWAVALILARPAQAIGEIPLEDLARQAPALCAQVLRAVQSDAELERLSAPEAPGVGEDSVAAARRLPAICGARDVATVVQSVEALRGVLWEALRDAATDPSVRPLGDLADRLAYVCSTLLAVALDAAPAPTPADVSPVAGRPVIVDERVPAWEEAPRGQRGATHAEAAPATARPEAVAATAQAEISPGRAHAEIEIRDQRGAPEGPAAWVGSIGAQLERFEREGLPFAVLLVEPVELERLRREEGDEELWRLTERLEDALRAELSARSASLTRERPGRCWLLAPGIDRAGAERLAQRLLAAVGSRVRHRGTALMLAIGTAVCPEDGRRPAPLAAHADVGLYAARAAARLRTARPVALVDESA